MATFCTTSFVEAPANLLKAIAAGPDAVFDFYRQWSSLVHDFQTARAQGLVTKDDAQRISAVVAQVETVAACFSDAEERAEDLLCTLLEDVSLKNARPTPEIFLADWLLSHLHDPYASPEDIESLAALASVSLPWVTAWLVNARQIIGWESCLRQRFHGDKKALALAARNVFLAERSGHDVPSDVKIELLFVQREAEKLRERAVATLLSEQGCDVPCVFLDDDEEDTSPPPSVAGVKRRRPDDECDSGATPKRARAQRASSASMPPTRQMPRKLCRNVSMPSSLPSTSCTFTLPTGQTLDVNALITSSSPSSVPSRKRCAADMDDAAESTPHISKRARASVVDTPASLRGAQQSLSEILSAPTGIMLPSDIGSWASNIVPTADFSLEWMHNTFDPLTPPSGEVNLSTVDWSDPSAFLGFDLTDYAVGPGSSSDDVFASFSVSTPSSPRSVIESLSGSDTSLESLPPMTGNDIVIKGIFDDATFDWGQLSPVESAIVAQMPEPFVQEKVDVYDPLASLFDSLGQDPLTGLNFGEDPFGLNYGEMCAPQFVP